MRSLRMRLEQLKAVALLPVLAHAQTGAVSVEDVADTGDTAWILVSSAFVLMMAMPGLTLFYGGLVRAKGFLAVLVQVGAIAAVASVLWVAVGYTLAFGDVSGGWIGGGNAWMLLNLGNVRANTAMNGRAEFKKDAGAVGVRIGHVEGLVYLQVPDIGQPVGWKLHPGQCLCLHLPCGQNSRRCRSCRTEYTPAQELASAHIDQTVAFHGWAPPLAVLWIKGKAIRPVVSTGS